MPWSRQFDWSVYYRTPERLTEKYLDRLMLTRCQPSGAFLDRLIEAHQRIISFENLDTVLWNRPVSLEPEKIAEKIFGLRRGGYCFELNGLFCMLLRELGFDAWLCLCRQLRHTEPCPVPATHCCILVRVDGRTLFCDVGYGGPMPRGSIEWKTDVLQEVRSERYSFQRSGITAGGAEDGVSPCGWHDLIWYPSGGKDQAVPLIQASPAPMYLSDFYGANLLRSTGDTRYGVLHVFRCTENGYIDLTGEKLTVQSGDKRMESVVKPEELPRVLLEYFQIR
ncbi:MAG: arylamine N-acetyltransferase [Clostridia bacterium]|nr:arylamine N-acetyltransferase [Clostridia bacterium]